MTAYPSVLFLFFGISHLMSSTSSYSTSIPVHPKCASTKSNLDIIFLVDVSYSLSTDECNKLQQGISSLIATIKQGSEPHISYIEFADHQHLGVTLDDPFWNNDSIADDSMVRQQYAQYVSNIPCHTDTVQVDVLSAIKFAQTHFKDSPTGQGRDRKIVLINGGIHDYAHYSTDPCDAITNGMLEVHGQEIEVIVVNIFDTNEIADPSTYLSCLTKDEPNRLFPITNLAKPPFSDIIDEFAEVVCDGSPNGLLGEESKRRRLPAGITTTTTTTPPTTEIRTECGSYKWCYNVTISPQEDATTSTTVNIYNDDVGGHIETIHEIAITSNGQDCSNPFIDVTYEEIDFSSSVEYFDVFENGTFISRCDGDQDQGCGVWGTCLDNKNLNIPQIYADDSYQITIQGSQFLDSLCNHDGNDYALNVILTITCSPTANPTPDPTSDPTIDPTTDPTSNPTVQPTSLTSAPTAVPTSDVMREDCGTFEWCYYVDLYPQDDTTTTKSVNVYNYDVDGHISTTHQVIIKSNGDDCLNPFIDVTYEEIDFSDSSEYFDIYEDGTFISRCDGEGDNGCGIWGTCLDNRNLMVSQINANESYVITIEGSNYLDDLCDHDGNGYALNVILTITCSPTANPTADPTSDPTTLPTAPTNAPTSDPTVKPTEVTSAPTLDPTNSPREQCGANKWCYDVDIYPENDGTTSRTVDVYNYNVGVETTHEIVITSNGEDCLNPFIDVTYEEIDFSSITEYLEVYEGDDIFISQCSGDKDKQCGIWRTCLDNNNLNVPQINADDSYKITIKGSNHLDNLCINEGNNYALNVKLTITCSPTANPTPDPTSDPTFHPTLVPTTPTIEPTAAPLPETCDDRCDSFSVRVDDVHDNGDEINIVYRISRLFDYGKCRKSLDYFTLGLCESDQEMVSKDDIDSIIKNYYINDEQPTRARALPWVWGSGSRNGSRLAGITVDVRGEDDTQDIIVELVLQDVFEDIATADFATMVRFDRGVINSGNVYRCDEDYVKGLPCIDVDKYRAAGFDVAGESGDNALINGKVSDDKSFGALEEVDPMTRWALMSLVIAFCLLLIVFGVIIVIRRKKNKEKETVEIQMSGVMKSQQHAVNVTVGDGMNGEHVNKWGKEPEIDKRNDQVVYDEMN